MFARYALSHGNSVLNLALYHDGNNENPAHMDEKALKTGTRIISIPIYQWDLSSVTVSIDVLTKNADGTYVVERKEFSSQ